ncbi:ATP-binding cassette domain-containing protein [Pseudalkalibacillus hwajinpoensis]|uniref:ATP-binding cassette domain-containing protein n=1 Tax=Guptibacillus hwajinpoensis TaxID=208199 RepID=A0A4U1MDT7_9BACL|nr:ATP-binding cassette domain-containing protein [Pseudalkalibacillus hwajinpoensis]TKD68306.1 ATP-binding cassette domain-containing protein [Pseudalkalibacillus hwajinpoensis]
MDGSILVHDLVKTYKGDVKAVRGVSFEVAEGEFFAFLGPNGAGKSTTVQILTTLVKPTSGTIQIGGVNVNEQPERVRWNIGVALQETGIDPVLTGRELIEMQARLFGFTKKKAKERASELLTLVDLNDAAERPCGKYSGGMRRRLDLALTLVHKPKILFLDEPTTGLDPSNRKAIWKEIKRLNKEEGTTIFLTTQYLEEADQLADRISIINEGRIVASGSVEELKRTLGFDAIQLVFHEPEEAERASVVLNDVGENIERSREEVTIYTENGTQLLSELVRMLDEQQLSPKTLNVKPPSLDDVFINVTNKQKERV